MCLTLRHSAINVPWTFAEFNPLNCTGYYHYMYLRQYTCFVHVVVNHSLFLCFQISSKELLLQRQTTVALTHSHVQCESMAETTYGAVAQSFPRPHFSGFEKLLTVVATCSTNSGITLNGNLLPVMGLKIPTTNAGRHKCSRPETANHTPTMTETAYFVH